MNNEKKRFYQKGWFLWMMLIFLPPVGIVLLWGCHKKMGKIIKIVLTVIFAYWFFVLVNVGGDSGTDDNKIVPEEQTEEQSEGDQKGEEHKTGEEVQTYETQQSAKTEESEEIKGEEHAGDADLSPDQFVEIVEDAIQWDIGEDEAIEKVLYENRDLCVYVDFSKADPSPLTYELLAESRTSSITDRILEFSQYDDLWDTITIDFGNVGYIRNAKDNIIENGYGRCFDPINFEITYR